MKKLIVSLVMLIALLGTCSQAYAAESTGNSSFDSFINDPRFCDGTAWYGDWTPELSSFSSQGCCAYCADFVAYCYGKASPRDGVAFYDTSEIRAGDVLTVGNQHDGNGHWFICLKRDGNRLYVAEGNYDWSRVRIGWKYTITSSNTFYDTDTSCDIGNKFNTGYHFENSYSLSQRLGSNYASDEEVMSYLSGHTVRLYSKETGQYVCGENDSTVHADGGCGVGQYQAVLTSDGWTGFRLTDGNWLSVQDYDYLKTTGGALQSWECFRITKNGNNFYLLSQKNNCYVQATDEAARPLRAARSADAGLNGATWEMFDIYIVD